MKMNNVIEFFTQAELALAAYAKLSPKASDLDEEGSKE
jgi:hypothetical protein